MTESRLIVIADDDADTRALVAAAIELMGHACVAAEDGQRAVEIFAQMTPDLAILDLMMPELSGLEACALIKEQCSGEFMPVLVLTARDELHEKVRALEHGADDYLTKPFHVQELQARVRALLRIRDLHTQLQTKNRELQAMQQKLIDQERQLVATQLGGAAAHRMGQPLSAIMLNCHLLNHIDQNDARYTRALEAIRSDAKRLADILTELRTVKAHETEAYCAAVDILKVGEDG